MIRGFNPPHILLASSNPMRMIQNLTHLLSQGELAKLVAELDRNVVALFKLGQTHFDFASSLQTQEWRQKVSRLYYSVYNTRRAVSLKYSGQFSTDVSDHKNIDQLPDGFTNRESYMAKLKDMREDRNLADYNHLAAVSDLVIAPDDAASLAAQFIADCKSFLLIQGVPI